MAKKSRAADAVRPLSLELLTAIPSFSGVAFTGDDRHLLFASNVTGSYELYEVPLAGGFPRRLTVQDEAIFHVDYLRGPGKILYCHDWNLNENWHIFLSPPAGGNGQDIVDTRDGQFEVGPESPDGRCLAYACNRRDESTFDTYLYNFARGEHRRVLEKEIIGTDRPVSWSSDGRYLLVQRDYHNLDNDLIRLHVKTGKTKNLTAHEGEANFRMAAYVPGTKTILCLSDEGQDFTNLMEIDGQTGARRYLLRERLDHRGLKIAPDGKSLVLARNRYGNLKPALMRYPSLKTVPLRWPAGLHSDFRFSHGSRYLAYYDQGPRRPRDLWVCDLRRKKRWALTRALAGGLTEGDFVAPRPVRYESFDGLTIRGLLYLPKGAKKTGETRAVLVPHGGPNYQNYNGFVPLFQYMASRGLAVFAPDFRGSTGYGKAFTRMIYGDWGGKDFQDLLAGVEWLEEEGHVDPKKIAVLGASYGGFATLTCVTRAPNLWAAAVDMFGPSNLLTFIESCPPSWRDEVYVWTGHPVKDRAKLEAHSPINHVKAIRAPLMVIQGKHDPRVVPAESEQIVKALRRSKRPVEYLLFEDEGHGFARVKNRIKAYKAAVDFIEAHVPA